MRIRQLKTDNLNGVRYSKYHLNNLKISHFAGAFTDKFSVLFLVLDYILPQY